MLLSGFEDLTALRDVLITESQHKSIVLNSSQENARYARLESGKVSDFFEDGSNLAGCTLANKAEEAEQAQESAKLVFSALQSFR